MRGWHCAALSPMQREIVALDFERRKVVGALQETQSRRNASAKEIGKAKGAGDNKLADKLIKEVADLKEALKSGEEDERRLTGEITDFLASIPNIPFKDVPRGTSEEDNQLVRTEGDTSLI